MHANSSQLVAASPSNPSATKPARKPPSKDRNRSRLTNGAPLAAIADGRGAWARRMRDLIQEHVSDLGGSSGLSEAQRQLIKRAATLETALEILDAKFAAAEAAEVADLDAYSRISGNYRRLIEALGLRRVPRVIDPVDD